MPPRVRAPVCSRKFNCKIPMLCSLHCWMTESGGAAVSVHLRLGGVAVFSVARCLRSYLTRHALAAKNPTAMIRCQQTYRVDFDVNFDMR